jgi:hypothetical protein
VGESKVDQVPFADQVALGERLAVVGRERKRPTDACSAYLLGFPFFFCPWSGETVGTAKTLTALFCQPFLFVLKVDVESEAGGDEHARCLWREHLDERQTAREGRLESLTPTAARLRRE